jgi:glycine cleavage system aminomethyltransferase T
VDGVVAGKVTSGTQTPTIKKSIGMAYLPIAKTAAGSEFVDSARAGAAMPPAKDARARRRTTVLAGPRCGASMEPLPRRSGLGREFPERLRRYP